MNEQLQRAPQRMTFSQYVNSKTGQALISNAIQNPAKRSAFVTAIVSAVAANPGLQECTSASIISAALQGVALGLAPSQQLGQFYMVPFKNKKAGTTEAQFVAGYKGLRLLAQNSGQYLRINALPVVEGEYKGRDKFTFDPIIEFYEDDAERMKHPVVGYYAYFILLNGYKETMYWSKEKMIAHADRYSPAFSRDATTGRYPKVSFADYEAGNYPRGDEWKYSSFWYKDFDAMAEKTMLRRILPKGPMSIEMQTAIDLDMQSEAQGVDYGAGDFTDAALPQSFSPEDNAYLDEAYQERTERNAKAVGGKPETSGEEQVKLDDL